MYTYIVAANNLSVMRQLPSDAPTPASTEWIIRDTDQKLRPQTAELLVRALRKTRGPSSSTIHTYDWAGLRLRFATIDDRNRFAALVYGVLNPRSAGNDQPTGEYDHTPIANAA